MTTTQLECFVTLAATLNYVRTAEELNMTQPGVSRQIQSLETELGERLFARSTRSVALTEIGTKFLQDAKSMLNTYYHSKKMFSAFKSESCHTFKIGYADTNCLPFIAKCLERLLKENENISPEFFLDQTDANLNRLSEDSLDLILGIKDARFTNEKIQFVPLKEEHFVCVVRKDHPLASKNEVSSEDLFSFRQIIYIPPYLLKNTFSRGRKIIPVNDDLNNILCQNSEEALALVKAGAGFAFLPSLFVQKESDLAVHEWSGSPRTEFGIYMQKIKAEDSVVKGFVETARMIISV